MPDNRLRKSEILRGFGSFRSVFAREQSIQADGLRCYYDITQEIPPGHVRVGFAVKRPTGSVERNRCKRMLRESYRCLKQPLLALCRGLQVGCTCVILIPAERFRGEHDHARVRSAMEKLIPRLCTALSAISDTPRSGF